jgi:glucuronate isomerase
VVYVGSLRLGNPNVMRSGVSPVQCGYRLRPQNKDLFGLASQLLDSIITPSPVVDIHTHIRPAEPAARDLGEIIFYHYISTALETAGVSREKLERAQTAEDRIALFMMEHSLVANTAAYWCLRQVLQELDIGADATLTISSLNEANRTIHETARTASWPRRILVERNNIRKTFLTLNVTDELPKFDMNLFAGALRLDDLLSNLSAATLQELEAVSGLSVKDLDSFERAVGARLTVFARSGGLAVTAGMPPEEDFVRSNGPVAEGLFQDLRKGESLESEARAVLHSYLLRAFVSLARDLHLPVQLMLGVRRPLPGDAAVPVSRPDLAVRFAGLFHEIRDKFG